MTKQAARRRQQLEMALGFLGFFGVVTLIVAVVGIIGGEPGVWPSVLLLAIVALAALTWRAYRRAGG